MAYVSIPEADSALGSFGCGAGCGCHGCRKSARNNTSGIGERYEREEAEVSPANSADARSPFGAGTEWLGPFWGSVAAA